MGPMITLETNVRHPIAPPKARNEHLSRRFLFFSPRLRTLLAPARHRAQRAGTFLDLIVCTRLRMVANRNPLATEGVAPV